LVAVYIFVSASMEMASSTISNLWPFCRRRDLLPDVNAGIERLKFFMYGPSDLASRDQFWICSHGCREEVCPRNICLGCYVIDSGDSYSRLSSDVDQTIRLLFSGILVLVLLPMVIDFNSCTCARSLGIATQIKFMREPC
jgi:hypothetical protein